ncbi:MAG TPA: glycosyltransferase family 4 protein [Actinomycetota bacterium]|nr:glycosyltransferase family 4 protein [Actinomycetota bacterium]
MRILFVVQRYGAQVPGGAELAAREFATRLALRGHATEVLTSCAVSYVDWANAYPPGTEELDGVLVHRLPVSEPREDRIFGPMHARVPFGRHRVPPFMQRDWMRVQGPNLPGLTPWLREHATSYDRIVFFTYLYFTASAGLPAAAGMVPTVLHPTAHDEPPLYLSLFDLTYRLPSALAFLTEEEAELVANRFHVRLPSTVTGLGVELDVAASAEDVTAFRAGVAGLGARPYLVYVGRVDPGKGSVELFDFFTAYKRRNPSDLALVVVGDPVEPMPPHPDIFITGFVAEPSKRAAMGGALALVQPSYFESFSLVLVEAWALGKPALVQGRCDVLDGHARRSGGGIPYRGFAEFEAALDLVRSDPGLAGALGRAGRRYVERRYAWDRVIARYEAFLERIGA